MRGLKGALINDFYLMRTQSFGIYLMGTAGMLIIAVMLDNPDIMVWAQMFVLTMAPLAALESSIASFANRWNVFEKAYSISPVQMVLSRYIIFIFLSLLCAALWTVSPFTVSYYVQSNFFRVDFLVYMIQLLCIIYYPVMYFLNPNKSSSGVVISFASALGAVLLSNFVITPLADENRLLIIAAIAAMYVVSIFVSVLFDKRNRGRA